MTTMSKIRMALVTMIVVYGGYQKGVAVFIITKGGLMYTATVAGQKFSYTPHP